MTNGVTDEGKRASAGDRGVRSGQALRIIGEIIRKEFHQFRQDRRMAVVSIVAPLAQVLLLGYAATTDIKNTNLVVCDLDRTSLSRDFVRDFTNSGYFVARGFVDVIGGVDRYIESGEATIALVIPRGFGDRVLRKEQAPVQMIVDGSDANTAGVLLGYASQIVGQFSETVVAGYASLPGGRRPAKVIPEPRVWYNPELLSRNFMVPGVVAMVLMIITMTLTSLAIVKEKEIGTLEQLMVTPVRPYQLIAGKLIPFIIIGAVDVAIVLSIARFWFGVPLRGSLLVLWGLSGLFILTTLGLGLFVSTISRTQQQAMLIAQFFFFMPFIFLSGFAFPIANMPEVIQYITYVIPLRYFLDVVRGVFLKGTDLTQLWPQGLALFAIGISILTLSIARFRKTLE
jgi:ABC-2 type transport system permease protein